MGPDSVVNLAYTALNTMRKEDREDIAKRLSAGQKLIDSLANPATLVDDADDDNGLVTWAGLEELITRGNAAQAAIAAGGLSAAQIAAAQVRVQRVVPIQGYRQAVEQLVNHMELLFGGQRNLFLNPANALPYPAYGNATSARVLYENVIMHDLVPLFGDVRYVNEPGVGLRQAGPLLEVLRTLLAGALRPEDRVTGRKYDQDKIDERIAKGQIASPEAAENFYASVEADAANPAGATPVEVMNDARARVARITQKFKQNPQYTKAASKTGLDTWLDQMNAAAERAVNLIATAPPANVAQGRRQDNATLTLRAVRRGSKFLSSGAAARAGFKTASRFNLNKAADFYSAGPAGGAGGSELVVPGSKDYNLLETPIMQGLIAAQMSQAAHVVDINDQYGSQFGVAGVPRSSRQDVGLEVFDDDYQDPAGVGAMFGRGAGDQELDQTAVDRL